MYEIDQDLEIRLARAFAEARMNRHEIITVEHLLIAILDDPSVVKVILHHKVDVNTLRLELTKCVNTTPIREDTGDIEAVPTEGFKRVFQRPTMYVQRFVAKKRKISVRTLWDSFSTTCDRNSV